VVSGENGLQRRDLRSDVITRAWATMIHAPNEHRRHIVNRGSVLKTKQPIEVLEAPELLVERNALDKVTSNQ
jgi:hypothetical protein